MFSLLLLLLLPISDSPSYLIKFFKVDNRAKVYVNDKVVFDTRHIDDNPDLNLELLISDYLKNGKNTVLIELWNGKEDTESDTRWEVLYELYKDNKRFESIWEYSDEGETGLVYSSSYDIFID